MDALILSCSTGGGHNAAGYAIKEELVKRGHHVDMMDPYTLVSRKLAREVGDVYVKMVQRSPKLFGVIYTLGEVVRKVPTKSPVYYANIKVAKKLCAYLKEHRYDVVIMPHLYPAELITYLRKRGVNLPVSVFVATDYVCIPFTEETNCDYYIVPGENQIADFVRKKIPENKILPFGIPTGIAFDQPISKKEARAVLGLYEDKKYILMTGGSVGAGDISRCVDVVFRYYSDGNKNVKLIIVCGNNEKLYNRLNAAYGDRVILIRHTDKMAMYMRACDIFISKPGGLSSTEAAVVGVPYIHISPIPGCESYNMRYFNKNGMSIGVKHLKLQLTGALEYLEDENNVELMLRAQKNGVPENARENICNWLEKLVKGGP